MYFINGPMRAGLIIGGAFMMVLGAMLLFTILFAFLGIFLGFVGFLMVIVGLVTSASKPQPPVIVQQSTQIPLQVPTPQTPHKIMAICPKCKARVPLETKFCPECGANLIPKKKKAR